MCKQRMNYNLLKKLIFTEDKQTLYKNIINKRYIHYFRNALFVNEKYYSGSNYNKGIPRSTQEYQEVLRDQSISPTDSKLAKIAIIGIPNSGKSTLINSFIGWRVCSVSQKVHTTQSNARAVKNVGSTQLIFLDTPGIVTNEEVKKHKLKDSMVQDPEMSIQNADCIAVLHDVSNKYTRNHIHPNILRLLAFYPTIPSVLILNKIDLIKKRKDILFSLVKKLTDGTVGGNKITELSNEMNKQYKDEEIMNKTLNKYFPSVEPSLETEKKDNVLHDGEDYENVANEFKLLVDIDEKAKLFSENINNINFNEEDVYSGKIKFTEIQMQQFISGKTSWPKFRDVFVISALNGIGVDVLRSYFLSTAQPGEWIFSEDIITDQSPKEIVLSIVREKCLEILTHNVPYELQFKIIYWDFNEAEVLSIMVGVHCFNKSHMKLLIGKAGVKASAIAKAAEQELRNTFRTEVRLKIDFKYMPKTNK